MSRCFNKSKSKNSSPQEVSILYRILVQDLLFYEFLIVLLLHVQYYVAFYTVRFEFKWTSLYYLFWYFM